MILPWYCCYPSRDVYHLHMHNLVISVLFVFLLNITLKIMHGTVLTSCMQVKVMSLCNIVIVSVRKGGGGFLLEGEKFS